MRETYIANQSVSDVDTTMSAKKIKLDDQVDQASQGDDASVVWDITTRLVSSKDAHVPTPEELFELDLSRMDVVRILARPSLYAKFTREYSADKMLEIVVGSITFALSYSGDGGWHQGSFSLSFSRNDHSVTISLRRYLLEQKQGTSLVELFSPVVIGIQAKTLVPILVRVAKKWIGQALCEIDAELTVYVNVAENVWKEAATEEKIAAGEEIVLGEDAKRNEDNILRLEPVRRALKAGLSALAN